MELKSSPVTRGVPHTSEDSQMPYLSHMIGCTRKPFNFKDMQLPEMTSEAFRDLPHPSRLRKRSLANSGAGRSAKAQRGIKNKRNTSHSVFDHIVQIQRKAKRLHSDVQEVPSSPQLASLYAGSSGMSLHTMENQLQESVLDKTYTSNLLGKKVGGTTLGPAPYFTGGSTDHPVEEEEEEEEEEEALNSWESSRFQLSNEGTTGMNFGHGDMRGWESEDWFAAGGRKADDSSYSFSGSPSLAQGEKAFDPFSKVPVAKRQEDRTSYFNHSAPSSPSTPLLRNLKESDMKGQLQPCQLAEVNGFDPMSQYYAPREE